MFITPGAFISAISDSYKAVQFVFKLTNVPDESAATVTLLSTVNNNLEELRKLRNRSRTELGLRRGNELERINQIIRDAMGEIFAVAKPVEKSRVDKLLNDGSVKLHHRITWVLRDAAAVKVHETALTTCNATILNELNFLRQLNQQAPTQAQQASTTTTSVEELEEARGKSTLLEPGQWVVGGTKMEAATRQRGNSHTREKQDVDIEHLDNKKFWLDWLGDHFSKSNENLLLPQDNDSELTSDTSWLANHSRERSREDYNRRHAGAHDIFL